MNSRYKDKETLVDMYITKDMTQREIASEFGCSVGVINKYIQRFNIKKEQFIDVTREQLREMYHEYGMRQWEIAEKLGCTPSMVQILMKRHDIETRHSADYREASEERDSDRYKEWRSAVYEKDNYECQICGCNDDLHAHHIIPWAESDKYRYDVDNGKILCTQCHAWTHKQRGDFYYNMICQID
ncbi:HNH endonuclease [Haloarcula tailed virus 2]|uniref:HNH endonuclease n=1 Tax=Haloarcula tailed virus 2 TaxID=2877989 RepID=A0AAE9BYT4_9CAUD|nr:HNH endonuclease [Haloarcula tailed virus 2]UBF23244.1 HNH endonuclease [Haloarcula tailed virus 2]